MSGTLRGLLLATAFAIVGVASVQLWQDKHFDNTVDVLLGAEAGDLEALCVLESYTCARRIDDRGDLSGFLSSIADIEEYSARKAMGDELSVDLLVEPQGIVIQARTRANESFAFGSVGVIGAPQSTKVYGSFRSVGLKTWLDSNVFVINQSHPGTE